MQFLLTQQLSFQTSLQQAKPRGPQALPQKCFVNALLLWVADPKQSSLRNMKLFLSTYSLPSWTTITVPSK